MGFSLMDDILLFSMQFIFTIMLIVSIYFKMEPAYYNSKLVLGLAGFSIPMAFIINIMNTIIQAGRRQESIDEKNEEKDKIINKPVYYFRIVMAWISGLLACCIFGFLIYYFIKTDRECAEYITPFH